MKRTLFTIVAIVVASVSAEAKWALVQSDGRIAQIEDKTFPVADPLRWVEVPDDTTTRHRYEGDQVVAPPAPVSEPMVSEIDAIISVLINKGVVSRGEIEAEKALPLPGTR
jgi:hypothetical protein